VRDIDKAPWNSVSQGSKVTLRGHGISGGVAGDVADCVITQAGPNPGIVVSAQELSTYFAADQEEAEKKYGSKCAYVDGEIVEKAFPEDSKLVLKLKAERDFVVLAYFEAPPQRGERAAQSGHIRHRQSSTRCARLSSVRGVEFMR
jgi:hypothetical protein